MIQTVQLVSTLASPLPCVRCRTPLPPGHRSLCLSCVDLVKAARHAMRRTPHEEIDR